MGELDGKVALVTGAARGLGAAIAEVFVREGARVILTDVLAQEGEVLARTLGPAARYAELDVTDEAQWLRSVALAHDAFGSLDILVNNAGLAGVYAFEATPPQLWDRLTQVMTRGPYLGIRATLPSMLKTGSGAIVNITSTNSIRGMANTAAYTTAKHGLLGLTRALALEYAPRGIRINAVCPGPMRTPMLKNSFGDQMESFAAHVPAGRLSEPREVAELVSFVASARASYCVGATFVADGGLTVG